MIFAACLQALGVVLVLAGAPLTGAGCCVAAGLVVAGERRPRR